MENGNTIGKNTEQYESLIEMQRHWVEFDRLQDDEVARLLKWCNTCCFRHWNTHTDGQTNFRFAFESEMDARRFIWVFESYFNPPALQDKRSEG